MKAKAPPTLTPPRKGIFAAAAVLKAKLDNAVAGADVKALRATLAARDARILELESTVAELRNGTSSTAEVKHLKSRVAELEGSQRTISQATVDQVAALGFDASKLPPAVSAEALTPEAKKERYRELRQQESRGEVEAGTAQAYWQNNRRELSGSRSATFREVAPRQQRKSWAATLHHDGSGNTGDARNS